MKKLPYGLSDFVRVKKENYYYIDKTSFISKVENSADFLFFLRPRRFGKSLFLNMLIAYYGIEYKDEYENIFKDTYILNNPTPLKNSFYIMKFDFSGIDVTDYENSFRSNLTDVIKNFIHNYNISIEFENDNPIDRLRSLFSHCETKNLPIYIFIDEYDNFVNKLLVMDMNNYKGLVTTNDAFYKQFFTTLKVGTSQNNSSIRKMFFTGVSPLALYDVTSGSNIGKNISTDEWFNDVVGITKDELSDMINYYKLDNQKEQIINRCDIWYDSYRFNKDIEYTIYNSDMILYYLDSIINRGKEPDTLIDVNVRTDYSKLKYLIYTNKKLNGNFDIINDLIQNNEVYINNLKDNFSAFEMSETNNFLSLLFTLGFVTIEKELFSLKLSIPNMTIKTILADFIEHAYKDMDFNLIQHKLNKYMMQFAINKDLEIFHYLNEQIKQHSSIRDFISKEAHSKASLITYLTLNSQYEVFSELEVTKGYVDLVLNPILPEIPYGAVLEIKYISKDSYTEDKLKQVVEGAKEQIARYDIETIKSFKETKFIKVILVYRAWELIYCEEVI